MRIALIAIISLCFIGCANKNEIEYIKRDCSLPSNLLTTIKLDTKIDENNEKEIALFMLNLYEAYKRCYININAIKEINDKWQ